MPFASEAPDPPTLRFDKQACNPPRLLSLTPMSAELRQLEDGIAAMQAQRAVLGDAVVDAALAGLHARLAALRATAAPEPEPAQALRQVSILFLDVVGSTTLSQRLDPEETSAVMDGVLRRGTSLVQAHSGRVVQYAGDSLLAVFGSEEAAEDDAERAVRCGLSLLELGRVVGAEVLAAHGHAGCGVRLGIHTGGVLLGGGGGGAGDESAVRGLAVNIAARMEQTAPAGALRISRDTYLQVRGLFEVAEQEPLAVKGVDGPIVSYLVLKAKPRSFRLASRGIEGVASQMVGRDAELARLRQAIAAASQGGGLQAVTVVAAAGLGKTRLLREALEGEAAGGLRLLRARAQPRDSLRAWGLLNQLVAVHCGITDGDSAEAARAKLLAGLAPGFEDGTPQEAERQAQLIGQLIGLDFSGTPGLRGLDPRAVRDLALAAVLAWLGGLCRQVQPGGDGASRATLVLAIEDLHWVDEASLDLLEHLMTRGRHLPLALLMNSRPELLERRPGWCDGECGTRITLAALATADSDALATALLQRLPQVPPALRQLLTDRAEGNPYYMEELLRRLLDDSVIRQHGALWQLDEQRLTQVQLPSTLVGLLQARLDALPERERDGAQRASIVGHVFWDAALAQVDPAAPAAMPGLQRRGWLQAHETSAFDDTAERQFDHHLLHQVTYETVLRAARRRGHAAVAHWLAERTADRGPEFLAITGEHAERAGDAALAIDCYERAAAQAQQRFANTLAIDCLQRALKLLAADLVQPRLRLQNSLRALADLTGNRDLQRHTIDATLTLLATHPDPHAMAELTMARAMLADGQGRLDDGLALARDALAQAVAIGDDDVAAWAHGYLCERLGRRGDSVAARAHQVAGQAHAERVRDSQPIRALQLLAMAGVVALQAEQLAEAGELLNQALARAETHDGSRFRRLQLGVLNALCVHAQCLGDWAAAADLIGRLADRSRAMGDVRRLGVALHNAGLVHLAQGEPQRALVTLQQAVAHYQASGDVFHPAYSHAAAGDAQAQLGDARAARNAYDQARSLFARFAPDGANVAEMEAMVARQDLALGDEAAARAGAERAAALQTGVPVSAADHGFESRWACVEVWSGLSDPRAAALLAQLQDRVRQVSMQRTGSAEAALQLQQRIPIFHRIMAATTHAPGSDNAG